MSPGAPPLSDPLSLTLTDSGLRSPWDRDEQIERESNGSTKCDVSKPRPNTAVAAAAPVQDLADIQHFESARIR